MYFPGECISFLSSHLCRGWVFQWFFHTHWSTASMVSDDYVTMSSHKRRKKNQISCFLVKVISCYLNLCSIVCRYEWVIYINPNYFGLSSVAFFVLSDFETDCTGTQVECYISSGPYTLGQFFFDEVNPYLHLAVSTHTVLCLASIHNSQWNLVYLSKLNVSD